MRALAGELKHSETAFVRRTGEGSFHIRYFTPAEEVDLCGHATIASFTVLRERRAIGPGTYALHTRSGDLSIQVGADAVWMDMAPPPTAGAFRRRSRRSCTPPTACPWPTGRRAWRPRR
ncbi:MAG: PhzF family phenazine biosynthesis protein [Flavonifractor plautii]